MLRVGAQRTGGSPSLMNVYAGSAGEGITAPLSHFPISNSSASYRHFMVSRVPEVSSSNYCETLLIRLMLIRCAVITN